MNMLTQLDWSGIFVSRVPFLEIFIRGTLMYLGAVILLRLIMRRQSSSLNTSDLLIMVLIADAAQNGMAGEYRSVPSGLFLIATLVFWDFVIDWLGYRYPQFARLMTPPPHALIKDGRFILQNMRRELISRNELLSQLRQQGIDDINKVKYAAVEPNGQLSVVQKSVSRI